METGRVNTYNVQHEFQGDYTTRRTHTDFIVVHHAAGLYPTPTGIEDVRAVARFHTAPEPVGRGWPGIGYHIALAEETPGGPIARYNLSDLLLQRANVYAMNHRIVGVSCLTNFVGIPGQKWIDALAETIQDIKPAFPQAKIVGHKEITVPGHGTTCPGVAWLAWKPRLLATVSQHIPIPMPATYRVIVDMASVRQAPDSDSPRAGKLARGTTFVSDKTIRGEFTRGSDIWVHYVGPNAQEHAELGWVHNSLVEML
jgi:hypothetical protein